MLHPFEIIELQEKISQYLHPKDIINLRATNHSFNHTFSTEYVQRNSAALKIQKYYKRYRCEKKLPFVFFNKMLTCPDFRVKYLYIHTPIIDTDPWLVYFNGDECVDQPHVCLKDNLPLFFKRVFKSEADFGIWIETNVTKEFQEKIQYIVMNMKEEERELYIESKPFSRENVYNIL